MNVNFWSISMDHFNDFQNRKLTELQFFAADWSCLVYVCCGRVLCDTVKPFYPVNIALASDFAREECFGVCGLLYSFFAQSLS